MHKKAPPQGYIWYTGMPVAKLYQTESEETDLSSQAAKKYFADTNFWTTAARIYQWWLILKTRTCCTMKTSTPKKSGSCYCWFFKPPNKGRVNDISMYQFCWGWCARIVPPCFQKVSCVPWTNQENGDSLRWRPSLRTEAPRHYKQHRRGYTTSRGELESASKPSLGR